MMAHCEEETLGFLVLGIVQTITRLDMGCFEWYSQVYKATAGCK